MKKPIHSPIRILLILWSGGQGGAERHVYDLVRTLPDGQFAPTVCFLNQGLFFGQLLRERGVTVAEFGMTSGYDIRSILHFFRWLKSSEFDIIHDHGSVPYVLPFIRLSGVNSAIVCTAHSRQHDLTKRMFLRLRSRTTKFVAVSEATKSALICQAGIDRHSIEVIPNFIDLEYFTVKTTQEIEKFRRLMHVAQNASVLTCVGRLTASKRTPMLLHMLAPLFQVYPQLTLLIVGDGPDRRAVAATIADLGLCEKVHMLGNRSDVPDTLGVSDIFVTASGLETFGLAVAEAMAVGIPVVAFDIPGLNEVIEDGKTGLLVKDGDSRAFADGVARLLDDDGYRRQLGDNARQCIIDRFGRKQVVKCIISVYQSVLADMCSGWPNLGVGF